MPVYTFHETCAENATLAMGDETTKIFLNSKGRREGINQTLAAFIDYIESKSADFSDEFSLFLQDSDGEWRKVRV